MSEQPESLSRLAKQVREASGVQDETLMEQMQQRSDSGKEAHLDEAELNRRIASIEQGMGQLRYRSDMERTLYLMLLERMRLRAEVRGGGKVNPEDPQFKKDAEVLQDLERRIAYWQYEEAALDEILDAVEEYEAYRAKYRLDRPETEGGVPRDAALETQVAAQLQSINRLLPRINLVRMLSFYEWKAERDPTDADAREQAKTLRAKLPEDERTMDVRELSSKLKLELRIILGTPAELEEAGNWFQQLVRGAKEKVQPKVPVPKPLELYRDAIWRHFESILARRKALVGNAAAGKEKDALQQEHMDLLGDACSFNMRCVRRRVNVVALLAAEGHFGLPVEEGTGDTSPFRTGPLEEKDRNALAVERQGNVEALERYVENFREVVLRERQSVEIPFVGEVHIDPKLILEDLHTTHVIPFKLALYEKDAEWATMPWGAVDWLHETVTFGLVDSNLREWRKRAVLQPILERLGLPANYLDLPPEEQKKAMISPAVQERIRSVKTIIDTFKLERGKQLDALLTDVQLLKQLAAQNPKPTNEPVVYTDMPDIASLKTDEERAGAMQFLIRRIKEEHLPALDRGQRDYMKKIGENIGLHVDVADADSQLGNAWMREWAIGGGTFVVEVLVLIKIVEKTLWRAVKAPVKYAWRGGVRVVRRNLASPKQRIANRLNRHPGMKSVEFADDAARAKSAVEGLQEAKLFAAGRDATQIAKIEEAIAAAHRVPASGPGGTWTRADIVKKWNILKEANLQPSEIKYLLRNGWCGRGAEEVAELLARNGFRLPRSLGAAGEIVEDAAQWRAFARSGSLEGRLAARSSLEGFEIGGRIVGGIALGWQAYIAFERWKTAVETGDVVAEKKAYLRDVLMGNSEKGLPGLGFTEGGKENEYVHKESGIRISLKSLDAHLDAETYARYAEAINASAGVAILGVSLLAGGHVGLVIGIAGMVVEMTVDATIGEWETAKRKEFLRDAPPWLLTAISIAGTLNRSAFSMVGNLTDNEWSDVIADLSKPEKVEIRNKLLFSILCEDLQGNAPGALGSLFAEKQGAGDISFVDTFYRQDFQQFILPFFYARLAQDFDDAPAFRWDGVFQLKDCVLPGSFGSRLRGRMYEDNQTNFIGRATPLQIRRALRDAVAAYLPHLQAKRAYQMRMRLAALRKEKGSDADETVTINGRQVRLSQLVAVLNDETTYGTAENGWKPRRIGDLSDDELAKLELPLEHLRTLGRGDLYGKLVGDPILRGQLADVYETEQSVPGFEANSWPLAVSVNELVMENLYAGGLPRKDFAEQFKRRQARHMLGLSGFVPSEFSPRALSERRLTEEVGQYFALHNRAGYSRSSEWEQKLFPQWNVTETAPNGEVVPRPRPLVLCSGRMTFASDLNLDQLLKVLADVSPQQEMPMFRMSNLEAVMIDVDAFEKDTPWGQELSTVLQATFFFTDERGRTYTMRRPMYVFRNAYRLMSPGLIREEPQKKSGYVLGKDVYMTAADFELDPKNSQMRAWLEFAMQQRITDEAIARSQERGRADAPFDPTREFLPADQIAEAMYAGEMVEPGLYVSLPAGLELSPGSPAMRLLDAVARTRYKDRELPYEADPALVFVEFDVLPDGTVTALATHVENMASTADGIRDFSAEKAIIQVRRCAAALQRTADGFAPRPIIGPVEHGYLRDCPSLLRYFGDRQAIVEEAFYGPKRRNQLQIEAAMLDLAERQGQAPALSGDTYVTTETGVSLLAPDAQTTVLFEHRQRMYGAAREYTFKNADGKKEKRFFVVPVGADRITLHYDDGRADREFAVTSAANLMNDPRLQPADRERIIDLYCTPLADSRRTLERLVGLFPSAAAMQDGSGTTASAVIDVLLPRYEKSPDKKMFLRGLFESLLFHGWVEKSNQEYLAKAVNVPLRQGAVRVPVAPGYTMSVYLHDDRIILTPPMGEFPHPTYDFALAEFTERQDNGYNFSDIQAAYSRGESVTAVLSDRSLLDGRAHEVMRFPINILTRQRTMDFSREGAFQHREDGFVVSGPREYRRNVGALFDREVVMNSAAERRDGEPWEYTIDGVPARQYGSRALLIREFDRNGGVSKLQYLPSAISLWDVWEAKLPAEMTEEMRARYEREVPREERVWRESNVTLGRWAVEQLTQPIVADRASEEYVLPARRIVNLFPCAEALALWDEGFRKFRSEVEDAYRSSSNPREFLKMLFSMLQSETKGKPISELKQLNSVRYALGIPEQKEEKKVQ